MTQKSWLSYYSSSLIFALLALPMAFFFWGWQGAYIVVILTILEVSLSIDNAVVNAKILANWDEKWRKRFVLWGMLVAVFGMRLVFPILIVSVTTGMSIPDVMNMAIHDPDKYAASLKSVHHEVNAFGAAFLGMVFLHFFLDSNKDEHWLSWVEKPLTKLGQIEAIEALIVGLVIFIIAGQMPNINEAFSVVKSGAAGIATYILVKGLPVIINGFLKLIGKEAMDTDSEDAMSSMIKQGIGGFIYLEVLDASFSFDGVIGAFALSNNIFVIMIGLGIGAFFVRSITLQLVDSGTMSKYVFLEHGAFWAIGFLSFSMFFGILHEVPEWFTGLMGAVLIVLAFWSSVKHNKKEADAVSYA